MGKFINPFTDVGFKIIFGEEFSKPSLLDFLNALFDGERVITNLSFLDKEQKAMFDGDRSPIYDILCETDSGEKIIVEMQNREHPNFKERMLYYASEAIVRQGEKGVHGLADGEAAVLRKRQKIEGKVGQAGEDRTVHLAAGDGLKGQIAPPPEIIQQICHSSVLLVSSCIVSQFREKTQLPSDVFSVDKGPPGMV